MLIDDVVITIKAGNGGNGSSSFRRNSQTAKGGPDGGNGGNGGSIYAIATDDIAGLAKFRYKKYWSAENGGNGSRQKLSGKNGMDLYLNLPLGTIIIDTANPGRFHVDLVTKDQKILLAGGGQGGRGNYQFTSPTLQTPKFAEKGKAGEEKKLRLSLKIIADIGLVGLPNAGKSSLLAALTNARPKIANYPFTTLEPVLGIMDGKVIADIPGIIENASQGKGLGINFLNHIERTRLIAHVIDSNDPNPIMSYTTIRNEFKKFNPGLLDKPEIIILTKIDTIDQTKIRNIITLLKATQKDIVQASIYDSKSLEILKNRLLGFADIKITS